MIVHMLARIEFSAHTIPYVDMCAGHSFCIVTTMEFIFFIHRLFMIVRHGTQDLRRFPLTTTCSAGMCRTIKSSNH
jgi:hypothetical protein